MIKKPHYILVFLNLIFLGVLYGDLLTNSPSIPEEIEVIFATRKNYGSTSSGSSRFEIHNFLYCKSGNKYEIGIVPEIDIKRGEKVEVVKTKFLNKVKSLEFKENGNTKKINLSFLLDPYILVFSILTFLFTIWYVYKNHVLIEFGLNMFSLLNYALTFVYLYYF